MSGKVKNVVKVAISLLLMVNMSCQNELTEENVFDQPINKSIKVKRVSLSEIPELKNTWQN